jgi:hypothetical protein
MKGRKELLEVLGINLGYVANNLLPIEWYDIVHRAAWGMSTEENGMIPSKAHHLKKDGML